jgi:three-Cys-motif partner protein
VYVDCFAGKGKFDDGSNGSPLIALEIIEKCKARSMVYSPNISLYFIDLNYSIDLQNNLANYNNVNIISGKYEEEILPILKSKAGCNVFLYIDPYGIKAL